MANSRWMIAGTESSCGKTWITCAIMRALALRGKKVAAFKCGPDYIDPMFHEKVLGLTSRNLDLYFTDEEETRALFLQDNDSDVSIVEGVMGLYDGLGGIREEASGYHLAKTLRMPILLVVNAHGKGRSIVAEIAGFLGMDHEKLICGVILNRISPSFYEMIKPVIEEATGVPVLGYMPKREDWGIESRHLGLKLPEEKEGLLELVTQAAAQLEKSVELDRILELARAWDERNPLRARPFACLQRQEGLPEVRIAVARDEAFCFYYRDNLRLLENQGARLLSFSPIRDKALPEGISGLYLGGGYPENWAKELSENVSMREQIRQAITAGMPSLAECGGFLYLHDHLETKERESHPMAGVLHGTGFYAGKLVRFGYAQFSPVGGGLTIRGHEFHYYDSDVCGEDSTAKKPVTGREWKCMHVGENHVWGFAHLYYPSAPAFAEWFVSQCRNYQK